MTDELHGKSMLSFIYMVCLVYTHTHTLYSPRNSPGQNNGVGSLSFLQGIFPTQGSNPGLPHCRWIFYKLSHKGSPKILGYPFFSGSFWPRNQTQVSCIAGRFFTIWAMREALSFIRNQQIVFQSHCTILHFHYQ